MGEIVKLLTDGWPIIAAAPLPVLLLMLVAFVAAWWLKSAIDKGEIKGLKAQSV